MVPLEERVWEALGHVTDPELDEPVTTLGFVHSLAVDGDAVHVRLRLPTFFCAPNFAWLMVADAHEAVAGVEGVAVADVRLDDYFAGEEINAGVAAGAGFVDAFAGSEAGEATGELDELRVTFRRKAYVAAVERVCREQRRSGVPLEALGALTLGDIPAGADLERLCRRRADLGMPVDPGAPLLVDEGGEAIPVPALAGWLRRAQTVRVTIEGNGELCRGLLRGRYHLGELEAELAGRR